MPRRPGSCAATGLRSSARRRLACARACGPRRWCRCRPFPRRARPGRPAGADRRDRQHRRRRRVPRPLRLPRPRLGHVHARRRVEPRRRAGASRARPSPRWTRSSATTPTPGSASATRTSRPTSTAPSGSRAGAPLSEVTAEIAARLGRSSVRLLPMTDDPVAHPHHGAHATTGAPRSSRCRSGSSRERAESPVVSRALRRRRRRPARARRARGARGPPRRSLVCPSNPVISIGPILAVPGVRDALRRPPRPGRRREPDRRRRAGEGPGRPADGAARHRGVVRRRRARVRRVLRHARDRRGRRAPRRRGRSRRACTRSSPTR